MSENGWPAIVAHRERLLRIARRRCPTREDAEDVVSEAMLRCATFEGLDEARLGPFLTTVTVRLCADLYRHDERRSRALVYLAGDPVTTPGPEDTACQAADAAVLRDLLSTLPARQRAVLVDRARGLSMAQIARRHALSYKAAESALSRARGRLRGAVATALGALVAVCAAVRPRRSVAVLAAVPVATLFAMGAVLRLPVASGEPRVVALPEVRPVPLARPAVPLPRAPRRARPAAVAPVPVAAYRRPAAPAAPASPGRKPPRRIVVGDDPSLAQVTIVDDHQMTPAEIVAYCAEHGVYVDADVTPGHLPDVEQGCG